MSLVVLMLAAAGRPAGQAPVTASVLALLERYRTGDLGVVSQLAEIADPRQLRTSFVAAADEWISREPSDAMNRRLVASSLALELSQARLAYDAQTLMVLLEWARKEWYKGPPTAAEHAWARAAVALVGRGGGSVTVGAGGRERLTDSSGFLEGAVKRFPDDARLRLALLVWPDGLPAVLGRDPQKITLLERLASDPDGGAEASLDLAFVRLITEGKADSARRLAEQAADQSTEPSTRYLSHFISAMSYEYQRRYQEAVREYAAALAEVPHAQSASIALAQLLLRDNQPGPAIDLVTRSLDERPNGDDPWRSFAYGEYVRWPVLIAEVRKAFR